MSTGVSIYFGLTDVTAKGDSSFACDDKQDFVDLEQLKLDGVVAPPVATLERNYWRLDGTFDTFPDEPEKVKWGLWSKQMSDEHGNFEVPIVLEITMQKTHSSIGISFEFNPYGNNYPSRLNIQWYHGDSLLSEKEFNPDNYIYFCENNVTEYDKLIFTFYSTNFPYRYLKIQSIVHGKIQLFDSSKIVSANLLEEIDITSSELSINTLDFSLYSNEDAFNIFNPDGIYKLLQTRQQLTVIGKKNSEQTTLGYFYLDSWKQAKNKAMEFSAVDAIGIMDTTYFYGGLYNNSNAYDVLNDIMTDSEFGFYIDPSLSSQTITGWIPYCTHREALQQVVFAIGAYVDTSNSGVVYIKKFNTDQIVSDITRNKKFEGTEIELTSYVTGIDIISHNYKMGTNITKLYEEDLQVGTYETTFSKPYGKLAISGASILESGVNYCRFEVKSAGTVTLNGYEYEDNQKTISKRIDIGNSSVTGDIKQVDQAYLVNDSNAETIAERLLEIYQKRIKQTISFIFDNELPGDSISIEIAENQYMQSIIKSLDIDLTGGFITECVTIGEQPGVE